MKSIKIGKENATFQQILALKENRNKRAQTSLFFVEGVQNIKDALLFNWEIEAFIYSSQTKLSSWANGILNKANYNYILDDKLMDKLSDKSDRSELLAIIKIKSFETIEKTKNPIFVVLDRPSKKGNLGTILRSCDAFHVNHVFYSGHSVDIYDPAVITASMGSFFKVPISFISSNKVFEDLIQNMKKQYKNIQIIGTSLQTDNKLQTCDFSKPTLLLIGNETDGLCKFYNEKADRLVTISMKDGIDSLNVACATSICLYEINRQRNF